VREGTELQGCNDDEVSGGGCWHLLLLSENRRPNSPASITCTFMCERQQQHQQQRLYLATLHDSNKVASLHGKSQTLQPLQTLPESPPNPPALLPTFMVLSLCAMVITVRPFISSRSETCTASSLSASSALVACARITCCEWRRRRRLLLLMIMCTQYLV
jgi:hypothetical protein